MAKLSTGTLLEGRYRIDALLATGGQGDVYTATQLALERQVAIKVLRLSSVARIFDTMIKRFEQEARLISQLRDPHTITLHDYGKLDDGSLYMVFEYIDGQSLKDVIEQQGQVAPERVARILLQTLASLQEAHELGVLHRDIKPQNIMLYHHAKRADLVKLLDFGIAKVLRESDHRRLTGANHIVGTPRYMAPELVLNEPMTPSTDLYSLGLVAYELLTGQPAIGGASPQEVFETLSSPRSVQLPESADVPAPLRTILNKLLQKDPAQRFAQASEVLEALHQWLTPGADAHTARALLIQSGPQRPEPAPRPAPQAEPAPSLGGRTMQMFAIQPPSSDQPTPAPPPGRAPAPVTQVIAPAAIQAAAAARAAGQAARAAAAESSAPRAPAGLSGSSLTDPTVEQRRPSGPNIQTELPQQVRSPSPAPAPEPSPHRSPPQSAAASTLALSPLGSPAPTRSSAQAKPHRASSGGIMLLVGLTAITLLFALGVIIFAMMRLAR